MRHSLLNLSASGFAAAALLSLSSLGFISPVSAATLPAGHLPSQLQLGSPAALQGSVNQGALSASQRLTFGLILPSQNLSGLMSYAQAVSNPSSPDYHHFLTHTQLMAQYGPQAAATSQITQYLTQKGFTAQVVGQMVYATGTVAKINAMFSTTMSRFQKGTKHFMAPSGPLTVPAALQSATGLTGLMTPDLVPLNTGKKAADMPLMQQAPQTAASPSGNTSQSSSNGFSVTARLISNGTRVPGMAVRYLITATLHGRPDADAEFDALSGPFQGAGSVVDSTATNEAGQFLVDFTFSEAQTTSMALTAISSGKSNALTATVQLPTATFVGPSAQTATVASLFGGSGSIVAPWNPSSNNVNNAFDATALTQEALVHGPAHLAVFTAGDDSSVSESDVDMFAQKFGLPQPHVSIAYTGPNVATTELTGYEEEESLDLQMMETSSPGANVQVYAAGSLRSALNQVVAQDTAQVFSISYGEGELAEAAEEPGAQAQWDMLAAEANAQGITVTISAGDSGAYEGAEEGLDTPMVSYPSNSPYVSSLGGTEASVNTHGQLNQSAMWGGNIGQEISTPTLLSFLSVENMIAGGGYSTLEPAPSYQQGFVPPGKGRGNPDFAFPASVVTPGYFAYFDGQAYFFGGTSASAPLFAGWTGDLALAEGHGLGNVNPAIYGLAKTDPALLIPVAYGNNGVYSVTPGYNAATGLGELNMGALLKAVTPPAAPGPSPISGPGGPGAPGGPGGPGH